MANGRWGRMAMLIDELGMLVGWTGAQARDIGAVFTLGQSHVQVAGPQDTAENILWSMEIPGGLLGPNDSLRISVRGTNNNSANSKTFRLKVGGNTVANAVGTTTTGLAVGCIISNRNSLASQVVGQTSTTTSNGVFPISVNTAQPFTVSVTGQLANAADSIAMESVVVELLRGA